MERSTGICSPYASMRHTARFHADPQQDLTTYTVFHGDRPALPSYSPAYATSAGVQALTGASARDPHAPSGFYATAQKFVGIDGKPSYRFGSRDGASSGRSYLTSNTLGSSGHPPVPYKSHLTEYVDEYREPVEHMDTLKTLTQKFNTLGGTRVTKRSTRSDGLPKYESRVVAF